MEKAKPNYKDLGYSDSMGPKLRKLVESLLLKDLAYYQVERKELKFDWSESCIEGKSTTYLDGSLDRYSSISVYDENDNRFADGWIEFIHEDGFFIVYWEYLTIWSEETKIRKKTETGIPQHIWNTLPAIIQEKYNDERLHNPSP
jgi:hypothetical protein